MTLKELAAAAGVSRPAISKNKKLNRTVNEDGTIFFDPADKTVQAFLNHHTKKKPRPPKPKPERVTAPRPSASTASAPTAPSAPDDSVEHLPPPPPNLVTPTRGPRSLATHPEMFDELDLDDALKQEKILTSQQNRAIKSRELVLREDVRSVFMRFYTVHTSILQALPQTLGTTIANELGRTDAPATTRVAEILDVAIYDALEEMKSVMTRQLKNLEAER